jgi:hypothetical protein
VISLDTPDAVRTALFFVVPGLIMVGTRARFLGGGRIPLSEAGAIYLGYSALYLAVVLPILNRFGLLSIGGLTDTAVWIALVFVVPAIIGCLIGLNARHDFLRRQLRKIGINHVHPIAAA